MADVTVLGMGAMGRALAATLVESGRSVTVWNRTPGRAVPGAMTRGDVAPLLKPWLAAMLTALPDGEDKTGASPAMQATAYVNLLDASRDAGVRTDLVTAMGDLLHRGVAAGPGVSLIDLLLEEPALQQ
jgi:shikimate 5-dehydrogenase